MKIEEVMVVRGDANTIAEVIREARKQGYELSGHVSHGNAVILIFDGFKREEE